MSTVLPLPPEFSIDLNLSFLQRSPREILHRVEGNQVFKVLSFNSQPVIFSIEFEEGQLIIHFHSRKMSEQEERDVVEYVNRWFDLQTDLRPFYAMAGNDALLGPLIKKYYGYRIVGQPDLYESLIWAVLGQQINLNFAYTLKQQFVRKYGRKLVFEGAEYFLFPEANLVSQLKIEDLLKIQFSSQKSRYTIGISEAFVDGTLSKEKLEGLPLAEAKEKLMKIKGIGNWTANYALMKTFRYPDAFPLEDAGLHNALRKLLHLDRKPTLDEIRKVFLNYKGWEAYATLYLWRSL